MLTKCDNASLFLVSSLILMLKKLNRINYIILFLHEHILCCNKNSEAVVAQRHKGMTETRRLWVRPTRGIELLCLNIFISSVWIQGKRPGLSSTQHTAPIRRKVG